MRDMRASLLTALLASIVATACAEDLPVITDIQTTRIIGARAEVWEQPHMDHGHAHPTATPQPGQRLDVKFQLVSPNLIRDDRHIRSMFMDCTYPERFTGLPICQEFFDFFKNFDPDTPLPDEEEYDPIYCRDDNEFTWSPPARPGAPSKSVHGSCVIGGTLVKIPVFERYKEPIKLIRGVICENGVPWFDAREPEWFGCDSNSDERPVVEMLVHGTFPVELEQANRNYNPSMEDVELRLNGRLWEATDVTGLLDEDELERVREGENIEAENCRDHVDETGLLAIDPFEHELEISMRADRREFAEGKVEDMEFSLYATAGEVSRRFTIFDGSDPGDEDGMLRDTVKWQAPKASSVPEGGMLVTLYVTVIDRRGGFDMAVRHACVYSD